MFINCACASTQTVLFGKEIVDCANLFDRPLAATHRTTSTMSAPRLESVSYLSSVRVFIDELASKRLSFGPSGKKAGSDNTVRGGASRSAGRSGRAES
eukprot:1763551-Prymnesium_polylepis.2